MKIEVNQQLLNAIVAGLNELPTKIGRPCLDEIERQVREANEQAEEKDEE